MRQNIFSQEWEISQILRIINKEDCFVYNPVNNTSAACEYSCYISGDTRV